MNSEIIECVKCNNKISDLELYLETQQYCEGGCGKAEIWDCSNRNMCKTCELHPDNNPLCWEVKCDGCGRKCGKEECPFDTGYDINENFICDDCPIDSDSD